MLQSLANSGYRTRLLTSLEQLRQHALDWNALCNRCDASPASQAELIAQWIDHFEPGARFQAVLVSDQQGQLMAAVPLLEKRLLPGLRVGMLPRNYSAQSGDLLLDPACDHKLAGESLLAGLQQLPWSALWLRLIKLDRPDWLVVRDAFHQQRLFSLEQQTDWIGQTELPANWTVYQAGLRKNHRKKLNRAQRRAETLGNVQLRLEQPTDPAEVEPLLQQGFAVEDRSWKGANGTSVLRTPGQYKFFVEQAKLLAERGQLRLTYLMHKERAIAFEYGFMGQQTYFSPKIGYDPEYAALSPGNLLTYWQHRHFLTLDSPPLIDHAGAMTPTIANWATSSYREGHVMLPLRPVASRGAMLLFRCYRWKKSRGKVGDLAKDPRGSGSLARSTTSNSSLALPQSR